MTEQIVGKPFSRTVEDPDRAFDNCIRYAGDQAHNGNVWQSFTGFSEANRLLACEAIKDSSSAIANLDIVDFATTIFCYAADSAMTLFQEHLVVTYAITRYIAKKRN